MTRTNLLKTLAAVAALVVSASAFAADNRIVIAQEDGKQTATFKLNGSACTLKNDVIRCTPNN